MTTSSLGQRTTNLTISQACVEYRTPATNRAKVWEIAIVQATATAQSLGLGRPQALGVTPVNVLFQPHDPAEQPTSLTIRLHANGAMSVEGPTGDKAFCRKLLDEAWHAINRQRDRGALIVPGEDVDSKPKESYL
jgi:hypothetical protein